MFSQKLFVSRKLTNRKDVSLTSFYLFKIWNHNVRVCTRMGRRHLTGCLQAGWSAAREAQQEEACGIWAAVMNHDDTSMHEITWQRTMADGRFTLGLICLSRAGEVGLKVTWIRGGESEDIAVLEARDGGWSLQLGLKSHLISSIHQMTLQKLYKD